MTKMYRIPKVFSLHSNLIAVETTRHNGNSKAPFNSLNLGIHCGDDPEIVEANQNLVFNSLGIERNQVVFNKQVHGEKIMLAQKTGIFEGFDALITNQQGLYLTITVADCVPVLIFDPVKKAVAGIHAGWRGTVKKLVEKTVLALGKNYGTNPEDCLAYIGTCIDECSFEVDADVGDHFETPFKKWDEERQKFLIDLKKANQSLLLEAGLKKENIEISPYSTYLNNEDYYSYRKEGGRTGRMFGIIGITN